jgi:hypothetical protein
MARTINSPGIQITEKDLSIKESAPSGTKVLITGFSPQGPASEPTQITSVSELETIYGVPQTPAEKYFYYNCREIINSNTNAMLYAVRLPYGEDLGSGYTNGYSALFYPMVSSVSTDPNAEVEWTIGQPKHVPLSKYNYDLIESGNYEWTDVANSSGQADVVSNSGTFSVYAGFVILNDLQSTINELGEGYYIGIADNSAVQASTSTDFASITAIRTLTTDANSDFSDMLTERLEFALTATDYESIKGITSVSESLEKVGFSGYSTPVYQDQISLGLFKIRRSTQDATLLGLATTEKYLGSFDSTKKQIQPGGGVLNNAFIEDLINGASPTTKMFVNPTLSHSFDWTSGTTLPTSRVTVSNEAKALFPVGVYTPDTRNQELSKKIGYVPGKVDKALSLLENVENIEIDVVIDGGVSTIYSHTVYSGKDTFIEDLFLPHPNVIIPYWREVTSVFTNFTENIRKDCFTILDAPRSIFVQGKDTKVVDMDSKSFVIDMLDPLKTCASSYESNYVSMYGNWAKKADLYSGKDMWLPFSAIAAAAFAYNDYVEYMWSAPAGINRGKFTCKDIAFNPNQKQRDRLYEISVNPTVFYQGDGYVIMGQKTLQTKPTAFDRINVRRLFLALERATSRTLRQFVFEPNTAFTRQRVASSLIPIFDLAKSTQGLYDYMIVVDERNNPIDVIENNEMVVDIYIKPVRTAEFILVNFIATRTNQDFQELL